jgi:signal transduction histidine kinase
VNSSLSNHPKFTALVAVVITVLVWVACLSSIAKQVGKPFPGFFYSPDYLVSGFTSPDFTGWQAGLRPGDQILSVNGVHTKEVLPLSEDARMSDSPIYRIKRGSSEFYVAVPPMLFSHELIWRFIPSWIFFSFFFLITGLFVFTRNPGQWLNRYLLFYLLVWACGLGMVWEYFLSQNKLSAYILQPWIAIICSSGWIFFWSFPPQSNRRLNHFQLNRAIVMLCFAAIIIFSIFLFLARNSNQVFWWRVYTFSISWGSFLVFGIGSVINKMLPLLLVLRGTETIPTTMSQAKVLLAGITIGLSGFTIFVWLPVAFHIPPPANPQWGALITLFYPLTIAYAVLRYHLFNFRRVVRKGMTYSLLTAALTAVFLLLSVMSGYVFQILTGEHSILAALLPALLVAFLFQPVNGITQKLVNRIFFRQDIELGQALTRFNLELSNLQNKRQIIDHVSKTIGEIFGVDQIAVWLREGDVFGAGRDLFSAPKSCYWPVIERMSKSHTPLILADHDQSPVIQALTNYGAVVAYPMLIGEKLTGVLTLGVKRSGEGYSLDDFDLLTNIIQAASMALDNVQLQEERLAFLKHRLVEIAAAQEEERKRIAQDLHDGVGPDLASVKVRLHALQNELDQENHPAAGEIVELTTQIHISIEDIRRMIYRLRPTVLDEFGLVSAMKEYVARWKQENGVEVNLTIPTIDNRLSSEMEIALFRLLQESLANIVKHSGANKIEIRYQRCQQSILISVEDNGCGFDREEAVQRARNEGHWGLWSMRERVELFGGRFEILSEIGRGTKIEAELPIG